MTLSAVVFLAAVAASAGAECPADALEDLQAAVLRIADYPSHGELAVSLDLGPVPGAREFAGVRLSLRSKQEPVLRTWELPPRSALERGGLRRVLLVPHLGPGSYRVALEVDVHETCRGLAGPVASFERMRFGWEDNALGKQPRIVPPFTPLVLRGNEVAAVLRTHRVGPTGLFDEVVADGRRVLAAPMRWDVVVDAKAQQVSVTTPTALEHVADDRVEVRAALAFGPITAALSGRFDVDGLYRISLALDGPPDARIDRFDLVAPLPANATLMNAVTDGARHHVLGEIPPGDGRVWSALQVGRWELPAGFVPYLWVGDESRGISWMTDTGRGFWFEPGRPMAEIRRNGARVDLVIHFASRPAAFAGRRSIDFALQVTPVKPRPPDWRAWQLMCEAPQGTITVCPLLTGWYWGAATAYGDVRPRADDYSLLDRFALLRRGTPLPPRAVDSWFAARRTEREVDPAMVQASLRWTAAALAHRPTAVVAYVNPRGVAPGPELQVFNDEWRPLPFADRGARDDGPYSITVNPVESFTNYALTHMDRLLATQAIDGFFIDNTFLTANWDERRGGAWRDLAGELQPGVDLFAMREFLRRAQTLVYQRRGSWWTVAHGTTTPISAIQGWAGIFLDGEWRYGATDFQQRFTRDLLRAGSLGTQLGAVPALLPGITSSEPARAKELSRSLAGVAGIHELRVLQESRDAPREFWERLRAFGYGDDRCAVHRYWDRPRHFELSGVDGEALVVSCGDAALALLVNYGAPGRAELSLDALALGLPAQAVCSDPERVGRIETTSRGCSLYLLRNEVRWLERRAKAMS